MILYVFYQHYEHRNLATDCLNANWKRFINRLWHYLHHRNNHTK